MDTNLSKDPFTEGKIRSNEMDTIIDIDDKIDLTSETSLPFYKLSDRHHKKSKSEQNLTTTDPNKNESNCITTSPFSHIKSYNNLKSLISPLEPKHFLYDSIVSWNSNVLNSSTNLPSLSQLPLYDGLADAPPPYHTIFRETKIMLVPPHNYQDDEYEEYEESMCCTCSRQYFKAIPLCILLLILICIVFAFLYQQLQWI